MVSEITGFAITGYFNPAAPPTVAGSIVGFFYWYEGLASWEQLGETPPSVPIGTAFNLAVLWQNQSVEAISGHVELTITKPDGTKVTPNDILNQNGWASPNTGCPVQFEPVILDQVGTYKAEAALSTMGQVLGERTVDMAVVAALKCKLTISASAGGTTIPEPGVYEYSIGTYLSISAYPDAGYEFVHWEENTSILSTESSETIFLEADRNIRAVFEKTILPSFNMAITRIDTYDRPYVDAERSSFWHVDIYCSISNPHSKTITHSLWIAYTASPSDPNNINSYRFDRKWDTGAEWEAEKVVTLAPGASRSLFSPWKSFLIYGWAGLNIPSCSYHGYPIKRKYYFRIIDELGNWSPVVSVGTYI